MTAYRVIDDHKELDNVGSRTHDEIDVHIDDTDFLVLSSSTNVPTNARIFVPGSGISFTDGGPGGNFIISVSGSVSSSAAGSDTQIQFNDGGAFGADPSFTFNKTSNTLTVNNISGSLTRLPDGSSYLVAGPNVTIVSSSNGSILISSAGGGGGGGSATLISWMETPTGDVDGFNMVYTLSQSPSPSSALLFYVNGVLQLGNNADYGISGNSVTMAYSPPSGSTLVATYPYAATVQNTMWSEVPTGLTDGSNTVFTLSNVPNPSNGLMFYVNGILQRQDALGDYTLSGFTVTTNFPPASGSNLIATYPY
jgi:hypothetical protein